MAGPLTKFFRCRRITGKDSVFYWYWCASAGCWTGHIELATIYPWWSALPSNLGYKEECELPQRRNEMEEYYEGCTRSDCPKASPPSGKRWFNLIRRVKEKIVPGIWYTSNNAEINVQSVLESSFYLQIRAQCFNKQATIELRDFLNQMIEQLN